MKIEQNRSNCFTSTIFSEIIHRLPDNTVTLEVIENNQVAAASGKANLNVNGLDADSYPHLPVVESQDRIEVYYSHSK